MSSIKRQFVFGVLYTTLSRYSTLVVSFIVTAILARLLTPENFGIVAISTVIINFLSMFAEMGFGPAIIQNKELNSSDISNIFIFTIFFAIFLGSISFLLSIPISNYYKNIQLLNICRILSITLVFNTLNIVPNALILKNKNFKYIAIRNFLIQFCVGILAIFAALKGFGIYSLIIIPIFSSIIIFILNYHKTKIKIKIRINFNSIKKITSFSTYQFLFTIINFFSRNLDKIIIGKYISMTELGYYDKSYQMMMLPIQNITNVITPVMQPILSDFQNSKETLLNYSNKIVKLLSFIGFALVPFLFFSAEDLIIMIFGKQWINAVPVFKILSFSVGIQMITSSHGSILQSGNATKLLFLCGTINSIINVSGVFLSIYFFRTIEAVAISVNLTFLINLIVNYYFIYSKMFKTRIILQIIKLKHPIILSLIIFLVLYLLSYVNYMNPLIFLIIRFILVVFISLSYVHFFKQYDIKKLIKNKNL